MMARRLLPASPFYPLSPPRHDHLKRSKRGSFSATSASRFVLEIYVRGIRKSPGMPFDESVRNLETMDELRKQWALRFAGE